MHAVFVCKTRRRNARHPPGLLTTPPAKGRTANAKRAFFSANSTPSAISLWLAEGVVELQNA
jgi:hypothetical protein